MALNVFVNFNGNCREAVECYAKVFGLETPEIMTFGGMPPDPSYPMTEETKKLVCYTALNIDGHNLMFADSPPEMPFIEGNNMSLTYSTDDHSKIDMLFNKLKEGGSVVMELQQTFWSDRYGMVIDKFGVGWQLSAEKACE